MKAVVPLGPKSGWKNHGELKYTIRALVKYADVTEIMVLGVKPDWLTNITFIPWKETHQHNKDANLIDKIAHAGTIWNDFIRFSDDQILVKPFVDIPYHLGTLPKQKHGKWYKRLNNILNYYNYGCYNFDAHIPVRVSGPKFTEVASKIPYHKQPGCCINTLYFNGIKQQPIKIPEGFAVTPSKVADIKEHTHVLNLKDWALTKELKKWLDNQFPEPSPFEK